MNIKHPIIGGRLSKELYNGVVREYSLFKAIWLYGLIGLILILLSLTWNFAYKLDNFIDYLMLGFITFVIGVSLPIIYVKGNHLLNDKNTLVNLAYYDSLTHLPNRHFLFDRIQHELSLMKRLNRQLILLFIDLDGFKRINDVYGHKVGDELLIEVARRLEICLRSSDTLIRLNGDEFLISGTVSGSSINHDYDVDLLCKRILKTISLPFILDGKLDHISCSIGVSYYPKDGTTLEELLRAADLAMYDTKKKGKNSYSNFNG